LAIAAHGACADPVAERGELADNAHDTPAGILAGELVNQLAERRVNAGHQAVVCGSSKSSTAATPYDATESRSPAGRTAAANASRATSGEQRPEASIAYAEPGSRAAPLVDGELLPQGEVFEEEGRPRPERASEATEQQRDISMRRSTESSEFRPLTLPEPGWSM
jgi:hypothetical protein